MAKSRTNVISEFKQALLKNDKKLMQSYVTEGVELPTFQKEKPIHEIKIVPSPKEDTTILISYFLFLISKALMMNLLSVSF